MDLNNYLVICIENTNLLVMLKHKKQTEIILNNITQQITFNFSV